MLNGAGMMHGGCICYIIDKSVAAFGRDVILILHAILDSCASFPLVALGIMQGINGVGVSQALNVFFHSPVPL